MSYHAVSVASLKAFVRAQPQGPTPIHNPAPVVPRRVRRDIRLAVEREETRIDRQRRQRADHFRPTTPDISPSVSPNNTPQTTPRTRRRAEVRERNPPESPQRRRVPRRQQNSARPPPLIARRPHDPNANIAHSLQGSFNVVYVVFIIFFP